MFVFWLLQQTFVNNLGIIRLGKILWTTFVRSVWRLYVQFKTYQAKILGGAERELFTYFEILQMLKWVKTRHCDSAQFSEDENVNFEFAMGGVGVQPAVF